MRSQFLTPPRIVLGVTIGLQLAILWGVDVFPSQDLPEWAFQGSSLQRLWTDSIPSGFPFEVRRDAPIMGTFVPTVLALLQFIWSANCAARVLASATLLLFQFAWWSLFSQRESRHPLRWGGLLMGFHWFFFMGFMNYLLALSCFLLIAVRIKRMENVGSWRSVALIFLFSFVLMFLHPVGVAFLVVFLFMYRITEPQWWIAGGMLRISLAMIPVMLSVGLSSLGHVEKGVEFFSSFIDGVLSWRPVILPFHRFVGVEDGVPLSILNGVWLLSILALIVWTLIRRTRRYMWNSLSATGTLLLLIAAIPIASIGDFYLVNIRFLLPGIILLALGVPKGKGSPIFDVSLRLCALGVTGIWIIQVFSAQRVISPIADELQHVLSESGSTLVVSRGFAEEIDKRPERILSGIVRPLLHVRRLADLEGSDPSPNTFSTGMLEPVRDFSVKGKEMLEYSLEHAESRFDAYRLLRIHENDIARLYQRVVIVGDSTTRKELRGALSTRFVRVNDGPMLVVLRQE